MANEALRRAMADRRMSTNELAARIGADPKTVGRWLVDEGRTPQHRLRWAVADALEVDENMIWPQAIRASVKTGADREVLAVYPTRSAMPRTTWQRLIADASEQLMFCGYTSHFLWSEVPDLSRVLREKAVGGVRVRFVLGDPGAANTSRSDGLESTPLTTSSRIVHTQRVLEPLRDVIEVRQSDLGWGRSVWRGDGQAVASWNVLGSLGHESPVFHLRRCMDGGLFDKMAIQHSEALWDAAQPVWN